MNVPPVQHEDPQAVLGRRVGAFVVDFLIAGAIYWGSFFLLAEERAAAPTDAVRASLTLGDTTYAITGGRAALFFLAFLVLGFLYWSVLPGVTGWTLGKHDSLGEKGHPHDPLGEKTNELASETPSCVGDKKLVISP